MRLGKSKQAKTCDFISCENRGRANSVPRQSEHISTEFDLAVTVTAANLGQYQIELFTYLVVQFEAFNCSLITIDADESAGAKPSQLLLPLHGNLYCVGYISPFDLAVTIAASNF